MVLDRRKLSPGGCVDNGSKYLIQVKAEMGRIEPHKTERRVGRGIEAGEQRQ